MFRNFVVARIMPQIVSVTFLLCSVTLFAQECFQANEIEPATRTVIDNTAIQFIRYSAQGDVQSLRENAIPTLASAFEGIQQTVTQQKGSLGSDVTIRREYYLDASKLTAPAPLAEFFCGVYGGNGHTPSSASFAIPNLDPGQYALVLTNVAGGKVPYMVTVIMKKIQNQWKLAGYYPKPGEVAGHDAVWYVQQARKFKRAGQLHNAWFYYVLGWEIYSPVDFMSSMQLDKLSNEIQSARPGDVPAEKPVPLVSANGRTFNLIQEFAAPDDKGQLSLVVKYQAADVSNTAQAFQDNTAVMKAMVAKYPELLQAFSGLVARATTPSGQDYGTLLAMKDIH
ncbi:MAG: hypothetical protein CXZ00_13730 [Acidobacteria bacterium]|nr:MAG: hypothetical protein CXZ00_13730 [Acidobacteriota bacterium]